MKERKHCCRTLTCLSGCKAGLGRISVACGNYPPRACKDRCMWKSGAVQRTSTFRKEVPSISLQVLCGNGCVKSRKFSEKHGKTWLFIRFSLNISERDQKRRQETPKVRKWSKSKPKEPKSEPKGAKMWAKGSKKWAKGSHRETKGSQKGAKGSQREPKRS